jgi:glycerol-3-phosphate dehydrogenase
MRDFLLFLNRPDARGLSSGPPATKYDVCIVGGGHNGLVAAAYLAKAGLSAAVFERRHVVGKYSQMKKV